MKKITAGIFAAALSVGALTAVAQQPAAPHLSPATTSGADDARINAIPIDKLVTATCRQAWQMAGRNQDGFFDIVARLAALSAANRDVNLPDDKAAGAKAGEWIRTQAIKDPDQLLYAVVDHAILYSISKGTATPTGAAAPAH